MDLKQIKIASEAKGKNIKDLATAINVPFSGLYRSIKENTINAKTLELIAKELNIPITVFFGIELGTDNEVSELKKKIIDQQNYISAIEKYLEHSKDFAQQQKNLIDTLIEELKRLNSFLEPLLKMADDHPELKYNSGIKEITKLLQEQPEHEALIQATFKDNPKGFTEYQNKVKEILNSSQTE